MRLGPVGLGTFPFSNVFGPVTRSTAEIIVKTFLDGGGRYIQTAPYYEGIDPLMGEILAKVDRDAFRLGTLCVKDRNSQLSGRAESIVAQCNDSLAKLCLDHIDVYLTSTPEATDAPFSETIAAMEELQRQGKVVEIGVCNVTLSQLLEYNASSSVRYVQNRFSLIDQEADRDVRDYCVQNGIGLIPYNVIEWGLLTTKILGPMRLREGDLRTRVLPVFQASQVDELRDWVRHSILPISEAYHTSIEALAIAWVISQPGVTVCLVGATSPAQIVSSLRARELLGDGDLLARLDAAYDALGNQIAERNGCSINEFLRNSCGLW